MAQTDTASLVLTDRDRERLRAALDSHIYWQLSDERYRNDGYVHEPGSDDPEQAAEIEACNELAARLVPVD